MLGASAASAGMQCPAAAAALVAGVALGYTQGIVQEDRQQNVLCGKGSPPLLAMLALIRKTKAACVLAVSDKRWPVLNVAMSD